MSSSDHLKADVLLVVTTIVAAFGWMFSKSALEGFSPLLFMGLRFLSAALVLLVVGGYGSLRMLSRKQWRAGMMAGSLFAVAMMFWVMGLHFAEHIGVGAFLNSLGVVLVPVFGLFFGERPTLPAWLSLPVVAAGMACLSLDSEFVMGLGELCFLAAAAFFSVSFILLSHASAGMPTMALTTIQLLLTGGVSLLVSAFFEDWQLSQPLNIWLWLLASVLIATSLRFFIQIRAQGMAPASHAAIIMTLEPVWTAILAAWWLNDQMSGLQLLGCSLIFLAMLIARWRAVRAALSSVKASMGYR
ncbi:DMT family transporter [Gynuella sunshinyii]|uniref:Putative permease n=1 Tax=Gynuella sunshinyii YC6258 TaxID=1445510 RepID=A0A0C5W3S4_9GAMM|nr:DMT family transporter [Gynuella sunshinyii]AJQ97259.1 putative permease [Gynuella sunshinyii YC6258]